jgi:hypothetical protein
MSEHIIQLLVAERDRLERAIGVLQGSSPKDAYDDPTMPDWVKPASRKQPTPAPGPKKRKMSAAGKRAIREGVRKRWAAINAAKVETVASKVSKKKSALAEATAPPPEDVEFKKKMSDVMKKAWKKRKAAAKKKA